MKKIFISYAGDDNFYFEHFLKCLKKISSVTDNSISIWSDKEIHLGDTWLNEIEDKIQECDLAILCISVNFLASEFIREVEFKNLITRRIDSGLKVIPIPITTLGDFDKIWPELESLHIFYPQSREYSCFSEVIEKNKIKEERIISHPFVISYINEFWRKVQLAFEANKNFKENQINLIEKGGGGKNLLDRGGKDSTTSKKNIISKISDFSHIKVILENENDNRRTLRTINKNTSIGDAYYFMNNYNFRHLPVVEGPKLVGILSIRDIAKVGYPFTIINGTQRTISEAFSRSEVSSYMTKESMIIKTDDTNLPIKSVLEFFFNKDKTNGHYIGCLLLVGKNDDLIELISYIDIFKNIDKICSEEQIKKLSKSSINDLKEPKIDVLRHNEPLSSAHMLIKTINRRSVPVIGENGEFLGIISDFTVLISCDVSTINNPVSLYMSKKDIDFKNYITEDMNFDNLLAKFSEEKSFTSLPVIDNKNKLIGVISYTVLLNKIYQIL